MSISLSERQRNLIYAVVLDRLTNIDEVWRVVETGDWQKAERLGREYADLLRLVVDDLGWGRERRGGVDLGSPPDVLRGALGAIRGAVAIETEEERDMRLRAAEMEIDRRDTLAACEEVLQGLGA